MLRELKVRSEQRASIALKGALQLQASPEAVYLKFLRSVKQRDLEGVLQTLSLSFRVRFREILRIAQSGGWTDQ